MNLLVTLHGNSKEGDLYYRYALVPFLPRSGDLITVVDHVGMRVDEVRFHIRDDAPALVYIHVANAFVASDFAAIGFTQTPTGLWPPPPPA